MLKVIKTFKRPEWTISIIIISLWSLYILKFDVYNLLDETPNKKKRNLKLLQFTQLLLSLLLY